MRVRSEHGLNFEVSNDVEQLISDFSASCPEVEVGVYSYVVGGDIAYGIGGYLPEKMDGWDFFDHPVGRVWLALSDASRAKLAGDKLIAVGRQIHIEGPQNA